jgi:sec-independent protein translocase protein TatA
MGLGMPEVVLILVIALIVFGPRKLPELGKSLGQAMSQFRKASDEFKRTWEQEVEFDKVRKGDTTASSSSYQPDYQADAGYGTDPDFNYGYDSSSSSSSTDSLTTENADQGTASASLALPAVQPDAEITAAAAVEKKAEPHWI